MVVSPDQVVGACLGSRIRAPGVIGGFFFEEPGTSQGAIYLIGGDMVKQLSIIIPVPYLASRIKQVNCPDNIGKDELIGTED